MLLFLQLSDFGSSVPAGRYDASGIASSTASMRANLSDQQEQARPVRFMAPEALRNNIWSEKSDVWAFGIM